MGDTELLDIELLRSAVANAGSPIPLLRKALQEATEVLHSRYKQNLNISNIVRGRAWVVDELLRLAWSAQNWPDPNNIALVAVGGYGRGELLPHSDIDLLLLTRKNRDNKKYKDYISAFLIMLWDIGLEPGHSVRSVRQCKQEAIKDITVATALMESRTLTGPEDLHGLMYAATNNKRVWPIKKFVQAKIDEQIARHEKYHDVDYALEPNIKTSPGGLRDIQTIAWVSKRHFAAESFKDLVSLGFLKESEEAMISKGQQFLWKLRYGLHYLEGRSEDRLLFDKQRELAQLFDYQDDEKSLGVEKLMKQYYRVVGTLRELNDVLLQHLDEVILRAGEREIIKPINSRFQIRNDYIEVVHPEVFEHTPSALIELFVLMGDSPHIKGIRAATIRLLRENRRLINAEYRNDIRNATLFIELLRTQNHMTLQLRRMARYGILGRYLPEFGQISGQMQHDLFHIYTVDAHTLQVVENMRKFRLPQAAEMFPVAAHIFKNLPKVELLYIAGLYHDIAKGRGGDHSELGKVDAVNFCQRHGLSEWDSGLVSWLVDKHLLMSMTAQRKDTNDPEVIKEFAEQMGDKLHLDYLYAMTVADICATNPELWNSWRATLLRQLYLNTKRAFRLGLENPINRQERIADKKGTALAKLLEKGFSEEKIQGVWSRADDEYFVRESPTNIVWHTEGIANFNGEGPLVLIQDINESSESEGATQVFIYTTNADYLFANSTAAFEKLNLNIYGARIFTSSNDHCMDTFTVLENNGQPVGNNPKRKEEIARVLNEYLQFGHKAIKPANFRRSRKEKYFAKSIEVTFVNSPDKNYSTLEINCPDQPGILASVGKILASNNINLKDARITTLGERVEDLFFITDKSGQQIEEQAILEKLQDEIKSELEERLVA
ncbi:MAG: [protein-PII] uridylyltransferase [Gammaproteobacteria bacterium]|nr:[protein-PII] uridylyltransferase [Gammaproteobacteria bacterium]MDD9896743.1 [protein-PII] uridylyltransferase [Gammaproteobacteria bacterium]MDD9957769.1 [protein-PII] uridylyltransferase [Gammaproteobacteria bacterium]